ncbi:RING finger protein nhl-1-like [Stylophora pistillata]|uniref:E3 ubiquitin-protein ligase TRIM71 n=1 Tax=Stylophora pistillata TaxID=50429 RepID=A0A2B4RTY4_STYPI|nr:RING finger protein nhl-1-like [Stylophora pistillata]PFX20279.1 E3 ubiquitin-protein ligase TRIM71 [Stylophora pistillata]
MSWIRDQGHLFRVLEEELKCPVCLEEFEEPKNLCCSHTVCKQCLSQMVEHHRRQPFLRCPTCRRETEIDFPGGIDNLPTNYIVISLISGKSKIRDIKEVEDRVNECKQTLQVKEGFLSTIMDISQSLGNRRQQVEGDIRQAAERIVQMVRAREEELIQDLNLAVARQQRDLRQQKEVMQNLIARENGILNDALQQINVLSPKMPVEAKASILSQLREIDGTELSMDIPEIDPIVFIHNPSVSESEQLTKLGKLEVHSSHEDSASSDVHSNDYLSDDIEIRAFGTPGCEEGEFTLPWGVAIRDDGCIAVADHANNRIQVFDSQGSFLHFLTDDEVESVHLPTGIAFDLDHHLVTFDDETHKIKVLDSEGRLIRSLNTEAELGNKVEGVSVDNEGRIIVTDSSNERVLVFHHSGHLCLEFGADGREKLGWPSSAVFHKGRFIVSDTFNHCLKVYNRHGVYLQQIGRSGREPGQFIKPRGLTVDSGGNILVCDSGNCRIQVLDSDGNFVKSFGGFGEEEEGKFCLPYSVAVGKQGELVVSDCNSHRIQIFRFPPQD